MTNEIMVGTISGVVITNGVKASNEAWKRASIDIVLGDGSKTKASTFNESDIDIANSLNGKLAEITYVKKGTYNNMTKGGIKPANGQATTPSPTQAAQSPVQVESKSLMASNNFAQSERKKIRGMCVSYSKDIFCSGKIKLNKLCNVADEMFHYVMTGILPEDRAKKLAEKSPGLQSADKISSEESEVEEEIIE